MRCRWPPSACSLSCGTKLPPSVSIPLILHSYRHFWLRSRVFRILVAALTVTVAPALARDARADEPAIDGRKQARATRLQPGSIRLDRRLDDEAWRRATPITEFVQAEPVEGEEPTDLMEIRFAYDDTALWVGARMGNALGTAIQAPMSRRDDGGQAEYLQIELDSYLDRRTAYMFGVTASGVRLDHYHSSDNEGNSDSGFDPVWEARTQVGADGWTAELWLPFSQLRFNAADQQVWGLNVKRYRPDLQEEVYWVLVGRTERGWSSRFGELRGINGVRPARRLEVLPYAAASTRTTGDRDRADPFDDGVNLAERVGADVKLGVGPNLTLEATVNPDFGQIEADPAEVNLSAFETFFGERRPFFLEGSRLIQGPVNNYFYSRRIGARPAGSASGDYVDYPETTTILGAMKLTGRLASGTSIGVLGAVTGDEFARTATGGLLSRTRVAAPAAWGVARVQQEFGSEGSTYGFQMTALRRSLDDGGPLSAIQTSKAITGMADTQLYFGDRMYEADFSIGFTYVQGTPAAIERIQRNNGHYFQRPDQPDIRLDPTRTTLGGTQIRAGFDKVGGRHWLWGANTMIESPEFEPNDMGRLNYAGDFQSNARLTYRETQPGRLFRSYSFNLNGGATSYFDAELGQRVNVNTSANFTLSNFWSTNVNVGRNFRGQDVQLTRGGPSMGTPHGWNVGASLRNSNASPTRWNVGANTRGNENGDSGSGVFGGFSTRPAAAWELSVYPEYSREVSHRQYVTTRSDGRPEVYGNRYIFGFIDRTTLSMQFRVDYAFHPDLTLEVYAEPFAASGRYDGFGELAAAQSRLLRIYGQDGIGLDRQPDGSVVVTDGGTTFTIGNRDFNVRSFRSNAVLRWEWRPGSLLYVVWQQNRSSSEPYGDHVGANDLFGSFSAPGDNIFAVKMTWWLSR
jgi:hypothetical protein